MLNSINSFPINNTHLRNLGSVDNLNSIGILGVEHLSLRVVVVGSMFGHFCRVYIVLRQLAAWTGRVKEKPEQLNSSIKKVSHVLVLVCLVNCTQSGRRVAQKRASPVSPDLDKHSQAISLPKRSDLLVYGTQPPRLPNHIE